MEGGTRAVIMAVPRPDYDQKDKGATSARPIQRMFLSEGMSAYVLCVQAIRPSICLFWFLS